MRNISATVLFIWVACRFFVLGLVAGLLLHITRRLRGGRNAAAGSAPTYHRPAASLFRLHRPRPEHALEPKRPLHRRPADARPRPSARRQRTGRNRPARYAKRLRRPRRRSVAGLESAARDDALLESGGPGDAVLLQRPRSGDEQVFCVLLDISRRRAAASASANIASTTRPSAMAASPSAAASFWRSTTAAWHVCGASPAMPARSTGQVTRCIRPTTACSSSMLRRGKSGCSFRFQQLAAALRGVDAGDRPAGPVHQPHPLEPRRQPDLFLRPRRLGPAAARRSTCRW